MAKGKTQGAEKRTSLLKQGTFWTPTKVGEKIRGTFLNMGSSQYGRVFKLQTADGVIAVPDSSVLADLDLSPHKGKLVEFSYLGKIKAKSGREYKNFSVDLVEDTDEAPF